MLPIILGVAAVFLVGSILFKTQLGILLKGFYGLFVKDMASTPEGAAAVYDQLISRAQDDYNTANDSVQRIAGQFETAKRNLAAVNDQLKNIEARGENLAKNQKLEELKVLASERNGLVAQVKVFEEAVTRLEPMLTEALEIQNKIEKKLRELKSDKTNKIQQLKLDKITQEMYDSLDDLKRNSNLDKLAGAVQEKMNEQREKAIGAKVVHDSKLSTKIDRATATADQLSNDAWVDSLTQKHTARKITQVNQENK